MHIHINESILSAPVAATSCPEVLTVEGYGFNIAKMARKAGLHYNGGQNTVTFFGALIYDE